MTEWIEREGQAIDFEILHEDARLEAYRLLMQEALRVESKSEDVYIHFGNVPKGSVVDPIPIDKYLDICIPSEYMSPETILMVYEKCREALIEFKWGDIE